MMHFNSIRLLLLGWFLDMSSANGENKLATDVVSN